MPSWRDTDKLTPKENYLRLCRGEEIEYLPTHTFFGFPVNEERPIAPFGTCTMLYREDFVPGAQTFHDDWGVEYTSVPSANGSFIPSGTHTNDYLIKDVVHWRDYIDKPRLYDGIDWKAKAEQDLKDFNRDETAVVCGSPMMPFQQLMAMLGFVDGLTLLYEEPEAILEIEDYMISYIEPHIRANVEYYKPDLFYILDDTATQRAPFISPKMFDELFLPLYARICAPAIERGIPLVYHNCGHCEDLLPSMVKLGVRYWDPAQPVNDIDHIQQTLCKEYNFNVIGGFNWIEPEGWPEVSEEYVRQQMRDNIDRYAPGGHFLPCAAIIGPGGDPLTKQVNDWLADESYHYRREWVKKQG